MDIWGLSHFCGLEDDMGEKSYFIATVTTAIYTFESGTPKNGKEIRKVTNVSQYWSLWLSRSVENISRRL